MNYEIINIELDKSGYYRVRVKIDENQTQFLKFKNMPNQNEINEVISKLLAPTPNMETIEGDIL
jgi:hypothetical protein